MRLYNGVRLLDAPSPVNIRRLDHGCLPMIHSMQARGIRVDIPYLKAREKEFTDLQSGIEWDLSQCIGAGYRDFDGKKYRPFSVGSPDQVARLLFQELRVQGTDRPPTTASAKRESTADDVLARYKGRHPAVAGILAWRELEKLLGTYVRPLQAWADTNSRVHTTFSVTTAATGRLSSKQPNCFTGDTEILTESGWQRLDEFEADCGVKVAQWKDGLGVYNDVIEFTPITGYVCSKSSNVIRLHNEHTDISCTADHRCLVLNRRTGKRKVVEARSYPTDHKQLHAGMYYGGSGLHLPDREIRLMVALQADGSRTYFGWDVTLKKERKVSRFKDLLDECGLEYRIAPHHGSGGFRFYIQDPSSHVRELLGPGKQFGPWLLRMTPDQIRVFTEELWHWDGCFTRRSQYASKNKTNADWVQTMLVLHDQTANVRRYVSNRGSVSWQVDVTRRNYGLTTNIKRERSGDTQLVYCVSVPSSFLVIRRNGKVSVTGNCQNIPTRSRLGKLIRGAFIASSGNVLVSCDLSQIEMRWAAHLSQDPTMMGVFIRDEDIHDRTACEIFGRNLDEITAIKKRVKSGNLSSSEDAIYKYFVQFERLPSKTLGFGILYEETAPGLQVSILNSADPEWSAEERSRFESRWTLEACEKLINDWYTAYYKIKEWVELQHRRACQWGMTWDAFGRTRLIPEVYSVHRRIKADGLRKASNLPITSSAQGTIKLAMAELTPLSEFFNRCGVCWPLLQIHDELITEVDRAQARDWADESREVMEHATPLSIPVKSSSDIAERWSDLK